MINIDSQEAFSPTTAANIIDCGRTKIFEEIKEGRLKARKFGRRTIILRDDLLTWLNDLPIREVDQS